MKNNILFVCDNRDSLNWGCRATSIALAQILLNRGNITTTSKRIADTAHPIGPLTPLMLSKTYTAFAWKLFLKQKAGGLIYRAIGGKNDFVTINPQESVSNFLKSTRRDQVLNNIRQKFDNADMVVINGEGSLIFRTPPRRDLNFQLFSVELAHRLDKPVYYLNAMASDCPTTGTNPDVEDAVLNTLNKCDAVVTRDPISSEKLTNLGLSDVQWLPDALFTWRKRYEKFLTNASLKDTPELFDTWPESDRFIMGIPKWPDSYICISGASRPPGIDQRNWVSFFEKVTLKIKTETGLQVVFLDPGGDDFLMDIAKKTGSIFIRPSTNILIGTYILANARAYLSGRFHPSILASLGGTPCTFLEANSHKTYSIQTVLDYEKQKVFSFKESDENIQKIIEDVQVNLEKGDKLRNQIIDTVQIRGNHVFNGILHTIGSNNTLIDFEYAQEDSCSGTIFSEINGNDYLKGKPSYGKGCR